MQVQQVPIEHVIRVWPLVEKFIVRAVYHQDDYTLDQVKTFVATGVWQLLVFVENAELKGALTINYFNRPNDRVAYVTFLGGKAVTTEEAMNDLKAIVIANGATCLEGVGRPAIVRMWKQLFGFTEKYSVVQLKLEVKNV